MTNLLLLGSGPGVLRCRSWPRVPFARIVAINNAWRVRPDWDAVIFPHDLPPDRLPPAPGPCQILVDETAFVPAMNAHGGVVYCGATMAFTAAYWALWTYRPRVIAMPGCDMVYPQSGPTHFYGTGRADPLRDDITLQSLEAKSARLMVLASAAGCAMVNLSAGKSRLVFPRATPASLPRAPGRFDARTALDREAALGYRAPEGLGWNDPERFDPAELRALDALWLAAAGQDADCMDIPPAAADSPAGTGRRAEG
ncbi:hypothetical protein [Rhodovulum sp.]|uniref:hypothetical protein n=1 Tax=Rhodovulum sp. TaxID=34009 RepID=UPI00257ABFD9|nr:hypothetical protein [Rhodovulum sp.]